jgi:thioredoxin 1
MATKVIKFYADWCGPCRSYTPTFEKVSQELTEAEFVNVNIDKDTSGLAAEYKIRSIPTTVVVKEDGTTIKEVGILSEVKLKELILF